MKTTALKYQHLYNELLTEIKKLPEGTRLPTVRDLMKRFEASQSTVKKALDNLKKEGFVSSHIGSGTFVGKSITPIAESNFPSRIDMIYYGFKRSLEDGSFHSELYSNLVSTLGAQGAALRVSVLDPDSSLNETVSLLEKLRPEFLITDALWQTDVTSVAEKMRIPLINLFPQYPSKVQPCIINDNQAVVALWLNHLYSLGHRKIAFLHGVTDQWYIKDSHERLTFFYSQCARMSIIPDPELVTYGGFTSEEGYSATMNLLDSDKSFTAIITNDSNVRGVYQALMKNSLRIGSDISVIGTDDISFARELIPSLSTVRICRKKIVKAVVAQINSWIQHKKVSDIMIEPELIARESTGKPGKI